MKIVELNAKGNFDSWDPAKLNELQSKKITEDLCNHLIFENDAIKLWEIVLRPSERIPFRRCKNSYSLTGLTGGVALSRIHNGVIKLIRFQKNDIAFWDFQDYNHICDFENIGEDILRISVTEFKTLKQAQLLTL